MSWGIRITIIYLGFVALILTLVFTCFGHKTELEYKDYYSRELAFQEQINASENAVNLKTPIEHEVKDSYILVKIPQELLGADLKGKITLLKPSNSSNDKVLTLQPDQQGTQIINGSNFAKGPYKMQIFFVSKGKSYYRENIVTLR